MPRVKAPVVVSANCLRSGAVVYLDAANNWVVDLQSAACFGCVDEATVAMQRAADEAVVIGAYLVPVSTRLGEVSPTHYREAIRLAGPGGYITYPSRSPALVSL